MRVLWVTTELTPFAKVGGLADVSSSLPKALDNQGVDIRILLPYYSFIDGDGIVSTEVEFTDFRKRTVKLHRTYLPESKVLVYLVEHPIFDSESIYGELGENIELSDRFATFSWIAANLHKHISWQPEVYHIHDWPTGPTATFIKQNRPTDVKSVFTIHNLAYQGSMIVDDILDAGISPKLIETLIDLGNPETIRYLRLGINHSDQVTTVSRTYAKEILTPEFGYGLEDELKRHPREVVGIVHGIDLGEWDPQHDDAISQSYDCKSLNLKSVNKTNLQKRSGIQTDSDAFLVGIVTRLVYQKGINLLLEIIPRMVEEDIQVIVLGTGEKGLEDSLQAYRDLYPDHVGLFLTYDPELSHQMFAGLDAFLVPSRYEPCGLTQLYSMRYGTVPIVRRTGGLADTVISGLTGYVFDEFASAPFLEAILRAFRDYRSHPEQWKQLQRNGMEKDLSWGNNAGKWVSLYQSLCVS